MPVFLYGSAGAERRSLADIRRACGYFKGSKQGEGLPNLMFSVSLALEIHYNSVLASTSPSINSVKNQGNNAFRHKCCRSFQGSV